MSRELELISLYSGSRGNCTLVRTENTNILIDAGGTAKALEAALADVGRSLCDISAIFITHEHGDHTHALSVITKKHKIPIHMTAASGRSLGVDGDSPLFENYILHSGEFSVDVGDMTVEAFLTPHDSVQCVGYKITDGKSSVGVATDLGYVTQRVYDMLFGCEEVLLESNHDREMVKNGPYTESLKRRILSDGGHLSNDDCAEIAAALARSGTHKFMLAHLSRENNTPEAALKTVTESLKNYDASVIVADQERITAFV